LGDYRGSLDGLLSLANEVVVVRDEFDSPRELSLGRWTGIRKEREAVLVVTGFRGDSGVCSFADLAGLRLGYASLLAHPERVLKTLRLRGVEPVSVWSGSDHGPLDRKGAMELRNLSKAHNLSAWIVSTKCACHFANQDIGASQIVIQVHVKLSPELLI